MATTTTSGSVHERLERVEKELGIDTKLTTRIAVVQDRSYSMASRRDETISGYNEYVKELGEDDSDEATLTLIQFDTKYDVVEKNVPVAKAKTLDQESYVTRGYTALYDAVGRAITDLQNNLGKNERALVVIMTDGEENSSKEFTAEQVKQLISKCEESGNWTFVFLGAGKDAWSGGAQLGLRRGQTVSYGEDAFSHGTAYAGLSATSKALRSGTSMSSFAPGEAVAATMDSLGASVEINPEGPLWTPDAEVTKDSDTDGESES